MSAEAKNIGSCLVSSTYSELLENNPLVEIQQMSAKRVFTKSITAQSILNSFDKLQSRLTADPLEVEVVDIRNYSDPLEPPTVYLRSKKLRDLPPGFTKILA